jgi:hypothetical protein
VDDQENVVPPMAEERRMQIQHTNMQVANVTTPANYFHVLRRQVHRNFRKPLVIATPKSLLRHKSAVSRLEDMAEGSAFQRFIPDTHTALVAPKKVRKLLLCSGKVYYELEKHREEAGAHDVAIARLEQIAPFPFDKVAEEIKKFPAASVTWVQEEPRNMGAWFYVNPRIESATRVALNKEVRPVSRRCSCCKGAAGVMDGEGCASPRPRASPPLCACCACVSRFCAPWPIIMFRFLPPLVPRSRTRAAWQPPPPRRAPPRSTTQSRPRSLLTRSHEARAPDGAPACFLHCAGQPAMLLSWLFAGSQAGPLFVHAIALSAVCAEPWSAVAQQLESRWVPGGVVSGLSKVSSINCRRAESQPRRFQGSRSVEPGRRWQPLQSTASPSVYGEVPMTHRHNNRGTKCAHINRALASPIVSAESAVS